MSELFIEVICEEIPARMQQNAIRHMAEFLSSRLSEHGLLDRGSATEIKSAIGPKHMAVSLSGVIKQQDDRVVEKRGPKVGSPQQAIDGFCKSAGILESQLVTRQTDKGAFYFAEILEKGRHSETLIPELVYNLIAEFPWPKSQRWGTSRLSWVRPLHYINVVLDGALLPGSLDLGGGMTIEFTNSGYGHSAYHNTPFQITGFEHYLNKMRELNVLVDLQERQNFILKNALKIAEQKGLQLRRDDTLLEEVCGLVESPNVLCGRIDDTFMILPDEVLVTSMRVHQKYFALEDENGKIAPYFLLVADRKPDTQNDALILKGNERVLRARLSDALFFWNADKATHLREYRKKLGDITFYKGLGQVRQKVDRMEALVALIASYIPECNKADAFQAAGLSKSDLVTGMVVEFPELQGVMGSYYASAYDVATPQVVAIRDHYCPQGADDKLPETAEGIAVSMADKIDTLVGFFGINVKPTGSKDPFALRRAALGILRMIDERSISLPLDEVLSKAAHLYGFDSFEDDLALFITERLKVRLRDQGISHDVVSAAIIDADIHNLQIQIEKVKSIDKMLDAPAGKELLEGWRRASNILAAEAKKDNNNSNLTQTSIEVIDTASVDVSLFQLPAETQLYEAALSLPDDVGENEIYGTIQSFSAIYEPITKFFETVIVNDDDPEIRKNRLNLLSLVCTKIHNIADLGKIEK
ncbi:MAG: glycine--tRNA ligase subunit beta [Alphaproteobacteria bacterium]|nr:glycine--tRNA ligase subunit beta [Alphaproteobacteria bacterium]